MGLPDPKGWSLEVDEAALRSWGVPLATNQLPYWLRLRVAAAVLVGSDLSVAYLEIGGFPAPRCT